MTDDDAPAHPAAAPRPAPREPVRPADLGDEAVALARRWVAATAAGQSRRESRTTARLAALVSDPAGLELAVRFVDRVARLDDRAVAARELAALRPYARAARGFLSLPDRLALWVGAVLARPLAAVVVPLALARLRALVGHLVADAGRGLTSHIARARAEGFRLNLNLLGEAVLGEAEATSRLERIAALARREDVDYVSVKVSAVASQLSPWDTAGSVERVVARLRPLYGEAAASGTFLNLDMEEYRDLQLTVAVFERLALDAGLHEVPTGIVLQAYLPDSVDALEQVTDIARRRVEAGGAPVKVRLVKGANLAMERVEAELHGWSQAPYGTKTEVDANYVRLLDASLRPERVRYVRIGAASHNLFHLALAHLLADARGVGGALDVEMLQGMAPAQARAVRADVGDVLLYTPVVARADFDVAISYLVRRLEENATPENFLHALFAGGGGVGDGAPRSAAGAGGPPEGLLEQAEAFAASLVGWPSSEPRRRPQRDRAGEPGAESPEAPGADARELGAAPQFANCPDTDPAVAANRAWAARVVDGAVVVPPGYEVHTAGDVDAAVGRALAHQGRWAAADPCERARVLRIVADRLEAARGDLVATMVQEVGKTVAEADPEVSEAVDFARYYALAAEQLVDGAVPGARFRPGRAGTARGGDGAAPGNVTVVTPPWNFPVAIPTGSALAALAAGSPVLLKPAPPTPRCAQVALGAVREGLDAAGWPSDLAQVLLAPEGDVGRYLVTHPQVSRVLLTGSIDTARLFASWRSDLEVYAETSGKNALVVTPSADVDLAVADAVRSAFGHAGQKCSAASLLILVGSVGRSERLRRQLVDAVRSLAVGPGSELGTTVGPLTEPAQGKLLRALTTLEPGESWWVEPRRLDEEGRLWSPGIKDGVAPGSFLHLTEVFGPVLAVMRAKTLDEAIALQNAVEFGLTGGIHTLDEREAGAWLRAVEVGNAYVNRHITGAVVRRQPFGGWKASVVGPGAKAGGPDYVAQLGRWEDSPDVPRDDDGAWLEWALADDERCLVEWFGPGRDESGLRVEANVHRYRRVPGLVLRVGAGARERDVARARAAARRARVPLEVSLLELPASLAEAVAGSGGGPGGGSGAGSGAVGVELSPGVRVESDAQFAGRVRSGEVSGRVRVVGAAPGLREAAALRAGSVTVLDGPVLASGRRELLTVLREQAVSVTAHRFGHLSPERTERWG